MATPDVLAVEAGLLSTASAVPWFLLGVLTALAPSLVSAAWSWWRTRSWDRVARDATHSRSVLRRMQREEEL